MPAKMYSFIIAISVIFGILLNTSFSKPAVIGVAVIFEFVVILVCTVALFEVLLPKLKAWRKIQNSKPKINDIYYI